MAAVWEPHNKFQKWMDVEIAACYAHVQLGNITQEAYDDIVSKAKFDIPRINEIEAEIHHDVIAFLTSVAEFVGPNSRFIHLGLTSSDVVDTAFSLLIQDSGKLLRVAIVEFMDALKTQAYEHKLTPQMGRTHGVHAEPLTFGLKCAVWYEEMKRNLERFDAALETTNVGKVSGAVGNYAHMPPELEAVVCERLGLNVSNASTQTLQRDRHASFMNTLAVVAGTLEKIATEIRALQKTEFNEVLEPFSSKQKGSSAMPHKKNPILCERVTGCARVIRGYAVTAMENQALWHERDISHSSTERIIFPDATILLDYMFSLMTRVMSGLNVNKESMLENIGRSYYVFYSQQLLLKMVEHGMSREDAYRIVQRNAHAAFDEKVQFEEKIRAEKSVTDVVPSEELDSVFDFSKYTTHIDTIFSRVFS
jgi:adenylosuccinate lyase